MRGSVAIFKQESNKWMFDGILSDTEEMYTSFGHSVSITGDTFAVGVAKLTNTYGLVGSVLLYSSNNFTTDWAQKDIVTSKDSNDDFGSTVAFHPTEKMLAVSSKYANIVAESDGILIESAGAVYIFAATDNEWKLQTKITALYAESGAYFGSAMAFNENTLYIAAPGTSSTSGVKTGAVYLVDIDSLQKGTGADGQKSRNSKFTSTMSILILILILPAVVFFGYISWKGSEMSKVNEIILQSPTMAPMHHKYGEQFSANSPMSVESTPPRTLRESIYDAFFRTSSTPVSSNGGSCSRKNEPGSPTDYEMVSVIKNEEKDAT